MLVNKHQRAKSKRIKKLQREMRLSSYKEAKRIDRRMMRGAKRLRKEVTHALNWMRRGFLKFGCEISAIAESLALLRQSSIERKLSESKPKLDGLGTDYVFIDESTPFEGAPALWPKENPYLKKEDIHD